MKNKKSVQKNPYVSQTKKGFQIVLEDKISHHLKTKHNFKTLTGDKFDELYCFDGVNYSATKAREIIKSACELLLGSHCKNKNVSEILQKIIRLTPVNREEFDNPSINLIPLANGVYDIESAKILKYTANYLFRFHIPVHYEKKAECPNFKKFVGETLTEDMIPVLQEWFGFCLYRRYFIKKGAIFVGEKDTGKTILLNVLTAFLGIKNLSGLSLQKIGSADSFSLSSMYLKHANLYDDLGSRDISDNSGFKISTGGGYVTAEYKFGNKFQFLNYAKLLFACNKIPIAKDNDDVAYFDRWIPFEFLNIVPEEEQNKFLLDTLITKVELSGILNWALEGLSRLLKNGKFSFSKSHAEIRRIMAQSSSPLASFSNECLELQTGKSISKEKMHELYVFWATERKTAILTKEQIGRQLGKFIPYSTSKKDSERYWDNVNLKEKIDLSPDTLDAFKNIIYMTADSIQNSDLYNSSLKVFKKVSKVSNSSNSTHKGKNEILNFDEKKSQETKVNNSISDGKNKQFGGHNEDDDFV